MASISKEGLSSLDQIGDGVSGKSNLKHKNYNRSLRENNRSYSAAVAASSDKTKPGKPLESNSKKPLEVPDYLKPAKHDEKDDKQQQENDKESKPTPQQYIKQLEVLQPFHSKSTDKELETIGERLSHMSVLDRHSEEKKKSDSEKKKMLKSLPQTFENKELPQMETREVAEKELKRSEVLMPPVDLLKLTQDKDQQAEKEMLSNKNVAHIPTRALAPIDVNKSKATLNGMTNGVTGSTGSAGGTGTGSRSRSRKKSREAGRRNSSRGRPAGRDKGFLPDHYKTEICRTHRLLGYCEYSENCQFAHGIEELRPRRYGVKYKTQLCKNYHLDGHCRFGSRCKFIHDEQRIQVGDREFWLISPSENLVRVEVVENTQRATQLKALIEAESQRTEEGGIPSASNLIPSTTGLTPTALPQTMTNLPDSTPTSASVDVARGSPHTVPIPPSSGHVPISPQSPNVQLPDTPFYTSTGYFQPATATSPSTGFPPAPASNPSSTMASPLPTPPSPGFLYSSGISGVSGLSGGMSGMSGMSSPSGSVPHTPVSYYGFGNFSPTISYSTLDYIPMAALDPSTPTMMSPLSTASPSPSSTPLHMSPIVPLTRTLHQTFSLRRASSQPQSQQASPAAMLRGRTLPTLP